MYKKTNIDFLGDPLCSLEHYVLILWLTSKLLKYSKSQNKSRAKNNQVLLVLKVLIKLKVIKVLLNGPRLFSVIKLLKWIRILKMPFRYVKLFKMFKILKRLWLYMVIAQHTQGAQSMWYCTMRCHVTFPKQLRK